MFAEKYLKVLRIGVIASLFVVFFVFKDLLFPFITSKQLSFNIIMEFLFAIWLVLVLLYPSYRPRKSYLTYGLIAFVVLVLVSAFSGVDFNLSFWGDAERMLGFFSLLHFFIFYLFLITAFRSWRQWRLLFIFSLVIAVLLSLHFLTIVSTAPFIVFSHLSAYSTLGNTSYVSAYLIFNIFFALILFNRSSHSAWRYLYLLAILIMLPSFWAAHTSGAIIALFIGALLMFFLIGLSHRQKTWRRLSLIIFSIAVIAVIGVFSQYQKAWFQHSFLRNLTTEKSTFQTRLISWRGAVADFKYHPWLGVGLGNYAVIFDRHFSPNFFNYAQTETYFDRAHNNVIELASTTGIIGLLAYLSIFVAALYYLGREFKKNGGRSGQSSPEEKKNLEIIILVSLITAYFIQNLALFDSLVSYMGLMITLAFIYFLSNNSNSSTEEEGREKEYRFVLSRRWEFTTLVIFLLGAYIFSNAYNLRPWRMFRGVIKAYDKVVTGNIITGVNDYQKALQGGPLDRDGQATLVSLITQNPDSLKKLKPAETQRILDYTIYLAQKNVSYNPDKSLRQMQLAQILDTASRYYYKDLKKFNYYSAPAMQAINRSIELSPGRIPVYLLKAQMQLVRGEKKEAIETIKYAISLNPRYAQSYCRLAQFYMFLKDDKQMAPALDTCVDLNGLHSINSRVLLNNSLYHYLQGADYRRALKVAQRLAVVNSKNGDIWLNLAQLYLISGDRENAKLAKNRAISLKPSLEKSWQEFMISMEKIEERIASSTASSSSAK